MIFYGTNSSRLKNGQLRGVECPNCNEQTSMNYSVFGKYFYIYWIPIFPIGKENILECNSCKRTFKLKELPQKIKDKFELEKHKGIPFLHFSGLAIIALVIGYFSYSNAQHKEAEAEYIKAPAIGDIYSIKSESPGHFTTMKITKIEEDSIYVVFNNYEIDKRSAIDQIDKSENYTFLTDVTTLENLQFLYEEKEIFNIERDE